jgi:capsular exopolysaccharide synthesis family protein
MTGPHQIQPYTPSALAQATPAALTMRAAAAPPEPSGVSLERYIDALRRYKWLIVAVTLVGSVAGVFVARLKKPTYDVQASIWITSETPQGRAQGPIRSEELLQATAWPDLLKSFKVIDNVVYQRSLFLRPTDPADVAKFTGFTLATTFQPGKYELKIAKGAARYTLVDAIGDEVERGTVGDSIGRRLGFRWQPARGAFRGESSIRFEVLTPRDASVKLRDRLQVVQGRESNQMRVSLSGTDPVSEATTLNSVIREFVATAAMLKKKNHTEFAQTLDQQRAYSERELRDAEMALENFRVNTITLPSEGGPVAAGVEATRDPVMNNFFQQKLELDNLRHEIGALRRALVALREGNGDASALWSIPSVMNGAPDLRASLEQYVKGSQELRNATAVYTSEYPAVRRMEESIRRLRDVTIPQQANALLAELEERATDLEQRVTSTSTEIRAIPTRTIEEMRLRRDVEHKQAMYAQLKSRYEETRLAEASASPDVTVLDTAAAPLHPSSNSARIIALLGVVGSLGAGIGLALLLDRLDRRFRYPSQITSELGLDIIGAVPAIRTARSERQQLESAAQVIEAFRAIRLGVRHAQVVPGPLTLTISSAGPGEGKSLVASNLALAFAAAGERTLLVDGDVRSGRLHSTFGVPRRPGLVDCLIGQISLDDALRETSHDRLAFLPSGSRIRQAPELLTSPALEVLFHDLRARYDVIIVDCAPLGAGIDPFAFATLTRQLLLVFRAGKTDRKLAQAKLEIVDRLPISVVGAVLNDVRTFGSYKYYAYNYGYGSVDELEEPVGTAVSGEGGAIVATR